MDVYNINLIHAVYKYTHIQLLFLCIHFHCPLGMGKIIDSYMCCNSLWNCIDAQNQIFIRLMHECFIKLQNKNTMHMYMP